MAILQCNTTGRQVYLEASYLIGRSERCLLRLDDPHVSSEHASIRWDGEQWILKDLGSLNRTYLDEAELKTTDSAPLRKGARVAFGSHQQSWRLMDDGGPLPMAVPEDGSAPIVSKNGLLPLPSSEEPRYTLYRDQSGCWVLDAGDGVSTVQDRCNIQLGERRYRLCLPQPYTRTTPLHGFVGARIVDLALVFRVSSDRETIELDVIGAHSHHRFSARTHNEMLLLLGRARREDAGAGLPPGSAGWLYQDDLCRKLRLDVERLNVDVYRIRRQFADLGLLDPAHVIERRARTRQIRIGVSDITESPL